MPIVENFSMPAGDTMLLNWQVAAADGVSLAGATIRWQMRRQRFGVPYGEPVLEKATGGDGISIISPTLRTFSVALEPEDTDALLGRYYHEAEVTDVSGGIATITTGIMTVTRTMIRDEEEDEES